MSERMMQIPVEDFLNSLKEGYIEYKECAADGSDQIDLAKVAGFCTTMEQILSSYGRVTDAQIKALKEPILGNISLMRMKNGLKLSDIDLEMPTILRRQQD